jgi:hypothetical protein
MLSAAMRRQRIAEVIAGHRARCVEGCEELWVTFGPLVWHAADVLAVDLYAEAWQAAQAVGYSNVVVSR